MELCYKVLLIVATIRNMKLLCFAQFFVVALILNL